MENTPLSLGDQIARLHGAVRTQERCAWIPQAVHTLILACLSRIFARLEQLVLLWQAGELPAPPPRTATRPTARRDSARAVRRNGRRRRPRAVLVQASDAAQKVTPFPRPPAGIVRPGGGKTSSPRRSARAPPPPRRRFLGLRGRAPAHA